MAFRFSGNVRTTELCLVLTRRWLLTFGILSEESGRKSAFSGISLTSVKVKNQINSPHCDSLYLVWKHDVVQALRVPLQASTFGFSII